MLPSCGYFKNIYCPFFASGLCERPHCHFRHQRQDVPSRQNVPASVFASSIPSTTVSDSSQLIQMYDEAIRKIQDEVASCESKTALVKTAPAVHSHVRAIPVPTYIPTPVNRTKAQLTHKEPTSPFPNYTPTPIAQLKRLHGSTVSNDENFSYDPTEVVQAKKKRRVEEYDPTKVTIVSATRKLSEDSVPVDVPTDGEALKFSEDSDDDMGGADAAFSDSDGEFNENEKENKSDGEAASTVSEKFDVVSQILQASRKSNELIKNSTVSNLSVVEKESNNKNKTAVSSKNTLPKKQLLAKQNSEDKTKESKKLVSSTNSVIQEKEATENLREITKSKTGLQCDSVDVKADGNQESLCPQIAKKCDVSDHNLVNGETAEEKSDKLSVSCKKTVSQKHKKDNSSKVHSKKEHKKDKSKSDKKSKTSDSSKKSHEGSLSEKNSSKNKDNKSKSKDKESVSSKKIKDNCGTKKDKSSRSSHHSEKLSSKSKTDKRNGSSSNHKHENSKKRKDGKEFVKINGKSAASTKLKKDKHSKKTTSPNKSEKSTKVVDPDPAKSFRETKDSFLSDISKTSNLMEGDSNHIDMLSPKEDESRFSECDLAFFSEDTDLDEHDTYEECWRIFNETPTTPVEDNNKPKISKFDELGKNLNANMLVPTKKRVAHKPELQRDVAQLPAYCRLSPAQAMHNRFLLLQQRYSEQAKKPVFVTKHSPEKTAKRVAHVPNAALLNAVAKPRPSHKENAQSQQEITLATTVAKGARRIAHVPIAIKSMRPTIPSEYGSKVPSVVRQRYLNLFIDECLKFCCSEDSAYERGLKEEKNAYDRSTNKTVYLNVAINTLKRLRDQAEKGPVEEPKTEAVVTTPHIVTFKTHLSPPLQEIALTKIIKAPLIAQKKTVSHEMVLGGAKAAKTSYSIGRKLVKPSLDDTLRGEKLYMLLKPYILNEQQLEDNGFPCINPDEPGSALFHKVEKRTGTSNDPNQRVCCRCQTSYRVDNTGIPLKIEECSYHWGKLWNQRIFGRGSFERRFNCCQGDGEAAGCCVGRSHVHEEEYDRLKGFVKTLPKPTSMPDSSAGIFALDCEMCYTTQGIELSRITVIGDNLKPVYEALVKPDSPVIDYNTRFSGINEDDLIGVRTSIRDVQAVLLSMFNEKTILMGHSLESDFRALRLIHGTVVDTSVVFPHKMGPPFKRALRTLMAENLNKIIQNNVEGHDSQEDALACMQLMLWKVKEDIKVGR